MTRVARRTPILGALAAMLVAPLGCFNESGSTGPTGPKIVGFGGGAVGPNSGVQSALVGSWSNTIVSTDSSGTRSTQTIWTFRADGTARRTTVITDAFTGVTTTSAADAVWQSNGGSLSVSFLPPAAGAFTFNIVVTGSSLFLNGVEFTRIA